MCGVLSFWMPHMSFSTSRLSHPWTQIHCEMFVMSQMSHNIWWYINTNPIHFHCLFVWNSVSLFSQSVCVNNSHSNPHCHSHIRIHIRLTSRCNVLSDTDADEEWQRQWWRSCRRMQWMRVQTRVKELSNAHMSVQSRRQRHIETCEYFIILLINGHYVPPRECMDGWMDYDEDICTWTYGKLDLFSSFVIFVVIDA